MARVIVFGSFAESLVNFRGPLLRELVTRGHSVVACAPSASLSIKQALSTMGVSYQDVPLDRSGLNPIRDLKSFWALVVLFREIRPDVLLSYTIKPVIYGSLAARYAKVPAVYSMITGLGYSFLRNDLSGRILNFVVRLLYKACLASNRKIFFQNPDDRATFEDLNLIGDPGKCVQINGSGVDVQHFLPVPLPDAISFLLIARLLRDKGVTEYVEAARIVKRRYPRVVFRLAGWIDNNPASICESDLRNWISAGLVEYLGKLDDVRPAIANSSVYVLPSYREGTPRTVLEAMAMGRAIITTDAPGCRETVVSERNGVLVPVRNAEALANAMQVFIENPTLLVAMGTESRDLATSKYDVRCVNQKIIREMEL